MRTFLCYRWCWILWHILLESTIFFIPPQERMWQWSILHACLKEILKKVIRSHHSLYLSFRFHFLVSVEKSEHLSVFCYGQESNRILVGLPEIPIYVQYTPSLLDGSNILVFLPEPRIQTLVPILTYSWLIIIGDAIKNQRHYLSD